MKYIRIKEELFWALEDDKISVYTTNYKLKKYINVENSESVFDFLLYLSSYKTVSEIDDYKFIKEEHKQDLLTFLNKKKYLNVIESEDIPEVTRLERFVSSFPRTNFRDYEKKKAQTNVLILGLGTGGSYLVEVLKKIGVNNFTVVDGDRVEQENLLAQNYSEDDIGRYKAEVIKEKYISEKTSITCISKFMYAYDEMKNIVNLSDFTHIINCADDITLSISIIRNIFKDVPDVKLYMGGYAVLQQSIYQVSKKNWKIIASNLDEHMMKIGKREEFSANSGSIFNAFSIAFSVGKMIFDDIYDIHNTDYSFIDFYTNNYFIGNKFDFNYFKKYSTTKEQKLKFINPEKENSRPWINPITRDNIQRNNKIYTPILNQYQKELMLIKIDKDMWKHCLTNKHKHVEYCNIHFDEIKSLFIVFLSQTFSEQISKRINESIKDGRFYKDNHRFLRNKSYSEKSSNNIILGYSVNHDDVCSHTNSIIHELLHMVFFEISEHTLDHERFVRRYHTEFLLKYISEWGIQQLSKNYITNIFNTYIQLSLVTEYEIHTLNDTVDSFFVAHQITKKDELGELVSIFQSKINVYKPLASYKYLLPIIYNQSNILKLEKELSDD